MLWKIKNFLFNLCKKKTILFVFFFVFLGLAYPRISSAFIVELAKKIAVAPFYYIVYVIVSIAIYMAGFAGSLLNWILSPDFISYSYTNPGPGGPDPNPVIRTGLAVTQGFANMFLVLILVYIAIATILQLADYRTKRILVIFIVVALLVNFSPVICGLIVDASNIIMNFFIQDLSVDTFSETMGARVAKMKGEYWVETEEGPIHRLVQLAVLVPFLFVLTFILLVLAVIFILRYLAIWLLVILSPIAFICYILPITKKYFDLWWKQFLNWCFIGVTCGFFLYLSLFLVMQLETNPGVAISTPDIPNSDAPFNAIMPYFVAVVFLGMGVVFGLATSAMGASTVINFAKSKGRGTARGVGRGAKWVGRTAWKRGIRPNVDRTLYRATEKIRGKGKGVTTRTIGAGIAKQWGKIPVASWFLPEPVRKYGQYRPALLAAAKEAENYDSKTLMDRVYTLADKEEKAAGNAYAVLDRVDAQDVFDAGRRKFGKNLSDDELIQNKEFRETTSRFLQIAQQSGMLGGGFTRKDPRLAIIAAMEGIKGYGDIEDAAGNPLQGEDLIKAAVTKAVSEARQHIAKWEPEILKNKYVTESMLGQFDRDRWLQVNRQVKRGQGSALNGIDSSFSDFIEKDPELKGSSQEEIQEKLKDLAPEEIEAKVKLKIKTELKEEGLKESLKEKGLEPKEIEKQLGKELKIRLGKRLPEASQDRRSDKSKALWKNFREHIKKENKGFEGYFKALEDKRIQQTGWRTGGYIPKSERWQGKIGDVLTPGKAAMGPSPSPPTPPPGAPKRPPTPPGAPKRPSTPPPGASKRS